MDGPEIVADYRNKNGKVWLQLGRFRIKILSYKSWFGNWCWDSVVTTREDARFAFRGLLDRGFEVVCGPVALADRKGAEISKEFWDALQCEECKGTGIDPEGA